MSACMSSQQEARQQQWGLQGLQSPGMILSVGLHRAIHVKAGEQPLTHSFNITLQAAPSSSPSSSVPHLYTDILTQGLMNLR